jgi:hypothetical protein
MPRQELATAFSPAFHVRLVAKGEGLVFRQLQEIGAANFMGKGFTFIDYRTSIYLSIYLSILSYLISSYLILSYLILSTLSILSIFSILSILSVLSILSILSIITIYNINIDI